MSAIAVSSHAAGALAILCVASFAPATEGLVRQVDDELGVAVAALSEGRIEEATRRLERLERERPSSADVSLFLGHAYRLAGDRAAALTRYVRGLRLAPDDPRLLIALGELQQRGRNLDEAAALYTRAIEAAPREPGPYRLAAGLEAGRGNHAHAVDHLERLVVLEGASVDDHVMLGVEAFLAQQFDRAATAFQRALVLDGGDPRAHYGLGSVQARRPDSYEEAVAHLRLAIELQTDVDGTAHYLLGRTLLELGDVDTAIAQLRRALEIDPEQVDAHYRLALAYARSGARDGAREHQERFAELTLEREREEALGKQRTTLMNAVAAAVEADDPAGAVSAVDELLATARDAETLLLAATVWSSAGQHGRAVETAREVAAAADDDWKAWNTLGTVLLAAGQPTEARAALESAIAISPANAFAHAALGDTLTRLVELEAAAEAYAMAIAVAPEEPRYHLKLANTYRALGERDLERQYRASYRRLIFARRVPRQQQG